MRAAFDVSCDCVDDTPSSRWTFDGLFDGERIAGTVHGDDGDPVGDFLCTRLFTFWGTPKPRAGRGETLRDTTAKVTASDATAASAGVNGVGSTPTSADTIAEAEDSTPPPGSHPSPLRMPHPPVDGARGLRWLDAGVTRTAIDTRKGEPRLHPGLHGLDLRDWLLVNEPTYVEQMAVRRRALDSVSRREEVLQASDPATYAAQAEALEMVHSHLRSCHRHGRRCAISLEALDGQVGVQEALAAASEQPPLEHAARLIQEDLVLMRPDGTGAYRMAAAAVFFSFGDLMRRVALEQHSMDELHAKVGNFDTHLALPVHRFMAAISKSRPTWRTNWSFLFTPSLEPHPDHYLTDLEKRRRIFPHAPETEWDGPDGAVRRLDARDAGDVVHMKVEYQTFRRLVAHPEYVLFTVHAHIEPLHCLQRLPRAAATLAANVRHTLQLEFRHYKGLGDTRVAERILAYIDSAAATNGSVVAQDLRSDR